MKLAEILDPKELAELSIGDAVYRLTFAAVTMTEHEREALAYVLGKLTEDPELSDQVRDWWLYSARLIEGVQALSDAMTDLGVGETP